AGVLNNVEVKGEIQTIASDVNHNRLGRLNRDTSVRVLAGLSADLTEDVTANLMFQYANIWGINDASGKSAHDYLDQFHVVEANVVLHNLFCCLEATVGRQFYGEEDSAVIYFGPNHYNAESNGYALSLDAVKVTYGDEVKALTLIAGRVNETSMTKQISSSYFIPTMHEPSWYRLFSGDYFFDPRSIYGADFQMNITDELKAQVYGYDAVVNAMDKHIGFYGAKLSLNTPVRVAAEYARNFGGDRLVKEHNGTGHMAKVDVAMDINAVTARGTFYYANDHFFSLGNYQPGLIYGHYAHAMMGFIMDVALFNIGADVKPADKWTVSVDGFSFQDHRMDHSAFYEADLTAKYAHNENVELFAGIAYGWGTDSDIAKGQLGMLIKF
ncbi:MAG: hypothetical protein MJ053_04005, partial [Elusimicrobiaceae bacterium]|nr:hypothetical protein [Elusimicrobiaceae bacterium]